MIVVRDQDNLAARLHGAREVQPAQLLTLDARYYGHDGPRI